MQTTQKVILSLIAMGYALNAGCGIQKEPKPKSPDIITEKTIDSSVLDLVNMFFVDSTDSLAIIPFLSITLRDQVPNSDLAELVLYMDSSQVYTSKFGTKEDPIKKIFMEYIPGKHNFTIYILDKNKKVVSSGSVSSDFGGIIGGKDYLPSSYLKVVGNSIILITTEVGIKEVILFEDMTPVKIFNSSEVSFPIDSDSKYGIHNYFADLRDLLGNRTITAPIAINYR